MTAIESPPPRHVAAAIAELVAEQVRDAWRYLDSWDALVSAGVPLADLRECLAEPRDTEPLRQTLGWAEHSERGLLALVGTPGTGKGYAAARWVLHRHRRGLFTHWLSAESLPVDFKARGQALERCRPLRALVIDDVGSGATNGDAFREQLTGLIKWRLDNLRPTMLCMNGEASDIEKWLGPRIMDRIRVAGSIEPIASTLSLRREADERLDAAGRGPEWYAAKRLVDLVGCEAVQRYDKDGDPLPLDLDVGQALDRAARREGYAACKRVRELLGLDARLVHATAQRIADKEAREVEWAAGTLGVKTRAMSMTMEGVAAAAAEKLQQLREEQRQQHEDDAARILDRARHRAANVEQRGDLGPYKDATPPAWAQGREGRRKLHALGFLVRGGRGDYRVLRKDGKHERLMSYGCASEDEAWAVAGLLCAEVDTRQRGESALREASNGAMRSAG